MSISKAKFNAIINKPEYRDLIIDTISENVMIKITLIHNIVLYHYTFPRLNDKSVSILSYIDPTHFNGCKPIERENELIDILNKIKK